MIMVAEIPANHLQEDSLGSGNSIWITQTRSRLVNHLTSTGSGFIIFLAIGRGTVCDGI